MIAIIIFLCVWYVLGVSGWIYWWTKDYDVELLDVFVALLSGFSGPLAWIGGWRIHGKHEKPIVLIKRRKQP